MTDLNLTHLEILVDASGSMMNNRFESQQGFELFVRKQRKLSGRCSVSLSGFSSGLQNYYREVDINQVAKIDTRPRGSSALYDCLARTIDELGRSLASRPESCRPATVIVLVVSDGVDNASTGYTAAEISRLVRHQSEGYRWKFIYLGSGHDAIAAGKQIGIAEQFCLSFRKERATAAYSAAAELAAAFRQATSSNGGEPGSGLPVGFSEKQRQQAVSLAP